MENPETQETLDTRRITNTNKNRKTTQIRARKKISNTDTS